VNELDNLIMLEKIKNINGHHFRGVHQSHKTYDDILGNYLTRRFDLKKVGGEVQALLELNKDIKWLAPRIKEYIQ